MLRTPLVSSSTGRTLDFSTGNPKTDKLIMVGAVVVIIGAVAFLGWRIAGGGGGGSVGPITKEVVLLCVNPQCSYQDTMNRQDYYERLNNELTFEELHSMNPRLMCPECNHPSKTVVQGLVCPNCGKWFVDPVKLFNTRRQCGFPATPPASPNTICPYCNTDVIQWRKDNPSN